jgi:hypothetical protein
MTLNRTGACILYRTELVHRDRVQGGAVCGGWKWGTTGEGT